MLTETNLSRKKILPVAAIILVTTTLLWITGCGNSSNSITNTVSNPESTRRETLETLTPKFNALFRKYILTKICYDHNTTAFFAFDPNNKDSDDGAWLMANQLEFKQLENGSMINTNEVKWEQVWVDVNGLICQSKNE